MHFRTKQAIYTFHSGDTELIWFYTCTSAYKINGNRNNRQPESTDGTKSSQARHCWEAGPQPIAVQSTSRSLANHGTAQKLGLANDSDAQKRGLANHSSVQKWGNSVGGPGDGDGVGGGSGLSPHFKDCVIETVRWCN